jgi:hypothetical protein
MIFEVGEEYETECGFKVRIYATDGAGKYPIHGAFCKHGEWRSQDWTEDGRYSDTGGESGIDIKRPNKNRIKQEVWIYVYRHTNGVVSITAHPIKNWPETLPKFTQWKLVACYPHTVDVEEGEGL